MPVNGLFFSQSTQIAQLALAARLPTVAADRPYVEAGLLASYGIDQRESYRRGASYVDRILKGAKAGDLPIEFPTSNSRDIDAAFVDIAHQRIGAVLVSADVFFTSRRVQLATLATRFAIPAIFPVREYAEVGGLMSYGENLADVWRRLGIYVGRVLKGERGLPVEQSTKFEFVVNLADGEGFGPAIPSGLLAIADEVIE